MEGSRERAENPPWWLRVIIGRRPKRTLLRAAALIVISLVVFKFVLVPIRVTGNSMDPTYRSGGVNFVNRLAYVWSKPKRGDVVGIEMSLTNETVFARVLLLKRIVGLPGEHIAISRGSIRINGQRLDEPYASAPTPWRVREFQLQEHEYYVIGDNRQISDLRQVEEREIVGKVLF